METILLIIVEITLIYGFYRVFQGDNYKKKEHREEAKRAVLIAETLPMLKGRYCEVIFKEPSALYGYEMTKKGTVLDADSEWVLISFADGKKELKRLLRISTLTDVREIR